MDRQHKDERAEDRHDACEQLREAHEQSLGKLIRICDNAADDRACWVCIKVRKGQFLNAGERIVSEIADDTVGDSVVYRVHDPLREAR